MNAEYVVFRLQTIFKCIIIITILVKNRLAMEPSCSFSQLNRDTQIKFCSFLSEKEVCKLGVLCREFRQFTNSPQLWNTIGARYGLKVTDEANPKMDIAGKIKTINALIRPLMFTNKAGSPTNIFERYQLYTSSVKANLNTWIPLLKHGLETGVTRNLQLPVQNKAKDGRPLTVQEADAIRYHETMERVRFLLIAGVQPGGMKTLNQFVGFLVGKATKKEHSDYQVELAVLHLTACALFQQMTIEMRESSETQMYVDRMVDGMARPRKREDIVQALVAAGFRAQVKSAPSDERPAKRHKT